jgi:DNA helicase HerA-like ATPase
MEKIKNFISSIATRLGVSLVAQLVSNFGGRSGLLSIGIGEAECTLRQIRMISYRFGGRVPKAESLLSVCWRRKRGKVLVFPRKEANPHIIIVGMSGFGKSTLFKSIMIDIVRAGLPAIVFDSHGEHEDVVRLLNGNVYNSKYSGVNMFDLGGATVSERTSELASLLKDAFSLGYIQSTKLAECIWYTYRKKGARGMGDRNVEKTPSIADLISELNIFIKNSRSASERNTLLHLKERMSLLAGPAFTSNFIDVGKLTSGVSSFSLPSIGSGEAQFIYIHELLRRLYISMKSGEMERGLRMYIMIDEAQFIIGSTRNDSSIIRKIVEEGRKYGIGIIIATHITSNLDRQITANAATMVSFYPREPSEINYISNAMSGNDPARRDAVRKRLRALRQNEAMVVSSLMRDPVVVRTARISSLMKHFGVESPGRSDLEAECGAAELARLPVEYSSLERRFGKQLIDRMIGEGSLDVAELDGGGAPRTIVMTHRSSPSAGHEGNVMLISEKLEARGIKHYVNRSKRGPDIVAYINGSRVAVEYETGAKNPAETRKMLASRKAWGFARTIVFVSSGSFDFYKSGFVMDGVDVADIRSLESYDFSRW